MTCTTAYTIVAYVSFYHPGGCGCKDCGSGCNCKDCKCDKCGK